MPIYAYRCESCGFQKDVLRKMSDAPLTDCPSCGKATFQKQVTAAGFQLKGSGWYVTDFRDNGNKSSGTGGAASAPGTSAADSGAAQTSGADNASSSAAAPAAPAPAAASGSGGGASPAAPSSSAA